MWPPCVAHVLGRSPFDNCQRLRCEASALNSSLAWPGQRDAAALAKVPDRASNQKRHKSIDNKLARKIDQETRTVICRVLRPVITIKSRCQVCPKYPPIYNNPGPVVSKQRFSITICIDIPGWAQQERRSNFAKTSWQGFAIEAIWLGWECHGPDQWKVLI